MEDRHPKRRIDKDNPYRIYKEAGKTYAEFEDGEGISRRIEIDNAIYDALNQFELDDLKRLNEFDRHIEHTDQYEAALRERARLFTESVEDIVLWKIQKEELHKAIRQLPKKQRRRLTMYYFYGLSLVQIAEIEHCSPQTVATSIESAKKKIIKFL